MGTAEAWWYQRWLHRSVAVVLGALLALAIAAFFHEFTHQYVFAKYGCSSSVQWFPPHRQAIAITNPASGCWADLSPARRRELQQAHLTVEAIGYQLVPLYGLVGGVAGYLVARRGS